MKDATQSIDNTLLTELQMDGIESNVGALVARTQYVEVNGRRLAYRSVGTGKPLVLCTRFRGNLDLWDPLFLDSLAAVGFRVITFDYSGLGLSTGEKNYDPLSLARDAHDLIEALDLREVVIGGWSLGGLAAQAFIVLYPAARDPRGSHRYRAAWPERQGPGAAVLRHGVEAREYVSKTRSSCSSNRGRRRAARPRSARTTGSPSAPLTAVRQCRSISRCRFSVPDHATRYSPPMPCWPR